MSRIAFHESPNQDFIVSHVRSQIVILRKLLESLEQSDKVDEDFFKSAIYDAESGIKQLRRFLND